MTTLRTPMLVINFKNYLEVAGEKSVKLAKSAEAVARELDVEVVVAPPHPSLAAVAKAVSIPVFAQHVDAEKLGSTTGSVVPEIVKACGAVGSLVNHSERRLEAARVAEVLGRLKSVEMRSMVCARTVDEVAEFTALKPDFVAIEPPELIGSGIAVSKARPEVVLDSVEAARRVDRNAKVVCGAGIVSGEDVAAALKLGSVGVLVASGIVKASDWLGKIRELAEPLRLK